MSVSPIQFGTDGWRAVIADSFTFENVQKAAQAVSDHFQTKPVSGCDHEFVIGYDRRFLSDAFARSAAEVLAGNGWRVLLTKTPTPTPAISWSVAKRKAMAGIMITASHNPPAFNGLKLKLHHGGPADENLCRSIESAIGKRKVRSLCFDDGIANGKIKEYDLHPVWFQALKQLIDYRRVANSRLNFAHEPLHGVGAGCFDQILKGTRCKVRTFHAEHDPNFSGLNPEPIARNYGPAANILKDNPADFCLVTDGDADRIGGMDGNGNPLSTHQIICLLLRHFVVNRKGRGRVVKALTTTSMIDRMCEKWNLPLTVTGVGFKYICNEMLQGDVLLGFEESGGIGFPNYVPERDGILSGLMILEMLAMEKRPLRNLLAILEKDFGPHRYGRVDMHFPMNKRNHLMQRCTHNPPEKLLRSPVTQVQDFDGVKLTAANGSWLMLRGSGTEPVLRIYAEAETQKQVGQLLKQGRRQALAAT